MCPAHHSRTWPTAPPAGASDSAGVRSAGEAGVAGTAGASVASVAAAAGSRGAPKALAKDEKTRWPKDAEFKGSENPPKVGCNSGPSPPPPCKPPVPARVVAGVGTALAWSRV